MKSGISFAERAKLAMDNLSKQQPTTLEEAREQVRWLQTTDSSKRPIKNSEK